MALAGRARGRVVSLFLGRVGLLEQDAGGAVDIVSLLFGSGQSGVLYDPSDISTLWQDTAGTTPVTATGQLVRRMDDLSGNGHHCIFGLSSGGAGFTYESAGGLHWIQNPDVSADRGWGHIPLTGNGTAWSLVAGFELTDGFGAGPYFWDSNTPRTYCLRVNNSTNLQFSTDGTTTTVTSYGYKEKHVHAFSSVPSTSHTIRKNGSVVGSAANGSGLGTAITEGAGVALFRRFTDANRNSGRIYGLIIRQDGALTGSDLDAAEEWCAARMGITI